MTQVAARRRPWRHTFYFRSKTLEGVHQFHLNFTKVRHHKIQVKFDKGDNPQNVD